MLSEGTLKVIVHSARHLVDVEHGGRNDPYVKLSLTHEGEDSYQRTTVKEDAGSQASWDETFEFAYSGEPNLYIEVMDKEKGVDELIGFAAIPLAQAPVSGVFDIFDTKGTIAGAVHISINDDGSSEPVPATSFVDEEHQEVAKSLRHKAIAGDVAEGLLAAGLAVGAGFLGKKLFDEYKAKKAEEEA
ncbi:hypothetical protein RO3G_17056 [Lichtheimia corymbifera JMRC:FSU:9682]|uniref:C2 domain-containing protein n=1 Tax=Lichtheimia corymbifera JMRC:FSU:9682 TaxID=1263082 RepID=A0A068RY74_9FUNG|nr:hypothetical protein RO3G_17056 [Lichtheimia corymbifera JMRC:FSU:9682]